MNCIYQDSSAFFINWLLDKALVLVCFFVRAIGIKFQVQSCLSLYVWRRISSFFIWGTCSVANWGILESSSISVLSSWPPHPFLSWWVREVLFWVGQDFHCHLAHQSSIWYFASWLLLSPTWPTNCVRKRSTHYFLEVSAVIHIERQLALVLDIFGYESIIFRRCLQSWNRWSLNCHQWYLQALGHHSIRVEPVVSI